MKTLNDIDITKFDIIESNGLYSIVPKSQNTECYLEGFELHNVMLECFNIKDSIIHDSHIDSCNMRKCVLQNCNIELCAMDSVCNNAIIRCIIEQSYHHTPDSFDRPDNLLIGTKNEKFIFGHSVYVNSIGSVLCYENISTNITTDYVYNASDVYNLTFDKFCDYVNLQIFDF